MPTFILTPKYTQTEADTCIDVPFLSGFLIPFIQVEH